MRQFIQRMTTAFKRADLMLLLLCIVTTVFGCMVIASTTAANASGPVRYVVMQIIASCAGIFLYILISSMDTESFSEHRTAMVVFNTVLLLLLIPFGTDHNSGNKSWIVLPLMPFDIQPAEICKITFVLIMASVMASHQQKVSSMKSVGHILAHLAIMAGLNYVLSGDLGVSLIFVFIFFAMAYAGGINLGWFALAGGVVVVGAPVAWNFILDDYQKKRIAVLFNPSLDPRGTDAMYHTIRAQRSLTGGGLTGQGLFQGNRTQTRGALFAQHTDFIFSAIGEELGFLGCALVLVLLFAIIGRCIWVGVRSTDYLRKLVCFGAASALIFQVVINIGMNLGVMPVIGLTLPFISYGGSSIISLYALLGLVSGVYARPHATKHERYIRPPL